MFYIHRHIVSLCKDKKWKSISAFPSHGVTLTQQLQKAVDLEVSVNPEVASKVESGLVKATGRVVCCQIPGASFARGPKMFWWWWEPGVQCASMGALHRSAQATHRCGSTGTTERNRPWAALQQWQEKLKFLLLLKGCCCSYCPLEGQTSDEGAKESPGASAAWVLRISSFCRYLDCLVVALRDTDAHFLLYLNWCFKQSWVLYIS